MNKINFATLALIAISISANAETETRETREIAMADAAVFWAIASSKSKNGRAACYQYPSMCSDDRGELGLALLGEKNSKKSNEAFIGLLKYKLDASLSEDYTCYALGKGRSLTHQLILADPVKLYSKCRAILKSSTTANRELLENVSTESVCSDESYIASSLTELKAMISQNKKCDPQDF